MKSSKRIEQLQVHIYWTTYLQAIQKSLAAEYFFYKTGEISWNKITSVLAKFDDYYRLSLSPGERFERFKAGYSTVVLHLLRTDNGIKFTLMCRANESKTGIFFEREQYADARNNKTRLHLNNCYELIRINKEEYNTITSTTKIKNGVWTIGLTSCEQQRIYDNFNTALLKRDYKLVKQICYGLHHLIGFAGVREVYPEIKLKLEKRFAKFMKSQKWSQYKVLSDLYKLPLKIGYVKKVKVHDFSIKEMFFAKQVIDKRNRELASSVKILTKSIAPPVDQLSTSINKTIKPIRKNKVIQTNIPANYESEVDRILKDYLS
jgi:hypothetical protein